MGKMTMKNSKRVPINPATNDILHTHKPRAIALLFSWENEATLIRFFNFNFTFFFFFFFFFFPKKKKKKKKKSNIFKKRYVWKTYSNLRHIQTHCIKIIHSM